MDLIAKAKQAVGKKAADLIEEGMLVGLGTGTTATCFINSLIDRCKKGLDIQAVATSQKSEDQAIRGGIKMVDINTLTYLDICVDGADEIDPMKRMIKGGGGALLREKIVASMSKEMVVMVDESKCVKELGRFPLPIEIVPFGFNSTVAQIVSLGFKGQIRMNNSEHKYITDSGHYIYDVALSKKHLQPEEIHRSLINIPGVVETGFFLGLAGRILVGKSNGEVNLIP